MLIETYYRSIFFRTFEYLYWILTGDKKITIGLAQMKVMYIKQLKDLNFLDRIKFVIRLESYIENYILIKQYKNDIDICKSFQTEFTSNVISEFLNKHHSYQAKGKKDSYTASQQFFEKLSLIKHLCSDEKHSIISTACNRLLNVHYEMNNFYNEPPFAERLEELVENNEVPQTAKYQFVLTVVTCYVGNQYGQCNKALSNYSNMIKNFTPKEIEIMLSFYDSDKRSVLSDRIKDHIKCRKHYKDAIMLINAESVPASLKSKYEKILR